MSSASEVTLPCELAERRLSLSEIGAIFVLYSLPKIHEDAQSFWSIDEDMVESGKALVEDGIIKFSKNDDDENIMEIDLTAVDSLVKDFWECDSYDDNDNSIWHHDSNCGDTGTPFRYELHPKLEDDRIVYSLVHSELGVIEDYVVSKDEGEELARIELRKEIENFKQEDLLNNHG